MAKTLIIDGNRNLKGEVKISGSKNCALCLIAGALLCDEEVVLYDIPNIKDIVTFIKILNYLNVKTNFKDNVLSINAKDIKYRDLDIDDVGKFRASYYLIGALINRFKHLKISKFGGCSFTSRPINFHLNLLNHFGVNYTFDDGYEFNLDEAKEGEFTLPYPSFGASINGVLFALASQQEITIRNVTPEVEFKHFIEFMKAIGGNIILNNNVVYIKKSKLHGTKFKNIPDRIESGTFLLMGPIICDYLKINNINPEHNKPLLDLFSLLDIDYELGDDCVIISKQEIKHSCFIETGLDEQISSDLQPLLTVFCLNIPRISLIKEKVYTSRFTHIEPLRNMGGFVVQSNQNILINGIMSLSGKEIIATDLRMAAAMVFACLCAEGQSIIHQCDYIDRGYETFTLKLNNLGADIKEYEN